jgi:hypothetical protein
MNVLASRINLAFFWLSLFVSTWLATINVKRKLPLRFITGSLLLIGVLALDWWAPKLSSPTDSRGPEPSATIWLTRNEFVPPEKGKTVKLSIWLQNGTPYNLTLRQITGSSFMYNMPSIEAMFAGQEDLWKKTESEFKRLRPYEFVNINLPARGETMLTLEGAPASQKNIDLFNSKLGVYLYTWISEYTDEAGLAH